MPLPRALAPTAAALTVALAAALAPAPAKAQGWDYGRNMFGFAQRPPGGVWSSYYHPQFDPRAWYPNAFGDLSGHAGPRFVPGATVTYPPGGGVIVRSSPGILFGPTLRQRRLLRRGAVGGRP